MLDGIVEQANVHVLVLDAALDHLSDSEREEYLVENVFTKISYKKFSPKFLIYSTSLGCPSAR